MSRLFGLTGGMASGKSSVARRFRERGIPVIDADVLAREVVRPGTPGLEAIRQTFGNAVLHADGTLDRQRLATVVFDDRKALAQLNAIVHPRVQERFQAEAAKQRAKGEALICYEVPLLFESGLEAALRPVVLVVTSEAQQIARAMQRDGATREHVLARLRAQMPLEEKRARADFVIENDGDLDRLNARTDDVVDELRRRFVS